jgi:hypothetical protein
MSFRWSARQAASPVQSKQRRAKSDSSTPVALPSPMSSPGMGYLVPASGDHLCDSPFKDSVVSPVGAGPVVRSLPFQVPWQHCWSSAGLFQAQSPSALPRDVVTVEQAMRRKGVMRNFGEHLTDTVDKFDQLERDYRTPLAAVAECSPAEACAHPPRAACALRPMRPR